eukprot:2329092-Prymnesium_polylepis.1
MPHPLRALVLFALAATFVVAVNTGKAPMGSSGSDEFCMSDEYDDSSVPDLEFDDELGGYCFAAEPTPLSSHEGGAGSSSEGAECNRAATASATQPSRVHLENEVDIQEFIQYVSTVNPPDDTVASYFGLPLWRVKYLKRSLRLTHERGERAAELPLCEELQSIWEDCPGVTIDQVAPLLGVG